MWNGPPNGDNRIQLKKSIRKRRTNRAADLRFTGVVVCLFIRTVIPEKTNLAASRRCRISFLPDLRNMINSNQSLSLR